MSNGKTDSEILLEDGATELRFGSVTVTVTALKIGPSAAWVKAVKRRIFEAARRGEEVQAEAGKKKEQAAQSLVIEAAIEKGVNDEITLLRDCLHDHSPDVLTDAILADGTTRQIEAAFRLLYTLENPTKRPLAVIAAMNMR